MTKAEQHKGLFITLLVCASVGLIASFVLSVEKIHLLLQPDAVLSCTVNVVLNCASVMKTWQSSLFGFPNPFIGLMSYPVLITLAVGYLAGARYKPWFMVGALVGSLFGLVFAYWLFFQSVYVIQVLCPWCLFVTVVTTIIFDTILRYNLLENTLALPKQWQQKITGFLKKDYDKLLAAVWLVTMALLVVVKFKDGLFGA
ncbi:MAG TPA: vitamin K epoxide reductase family protein [Candidatus Saccharimonadales bacterium]|nr:vitamin K epoxide reductase family protein [Candidatus Saccharimonadales bacterium]